MKANSLIVLSIVLFIACGSEEKKEPLEKIWETEQILKTPESVIFDKANNVFYVSNVNENPWEKDGNGSVAKLSKDGKVLDVDWVTGMSAPKGMGIYDGKLYVADCDEVLEIDIHTASITKRVLADSAKTLNDIDIDKATGTVYISDAGKGHVYKLADTNLVLWQIIDGQPNINGLFTLSDALLVGGDRVTKVDFQTGEQKVFITETGGIDGIEMVSDDKYVISDWVGTIQLISPTDSVKILLDTKPDKINAADIEFIVDENLLLVPTFYDNRVVAYRLNQ